MELYTLLYLNSSHKKVIGERVYLFPLPCIVHKQDSEYTITDLISHAKVCSGLTKDTAIANARLRLGKLSTKDINLLALACAKRLLSAHNGTTMTSLRKLNENPPRVALCCDCNSEIDLEDDEYVQHNNDIVCQSCYEDNYFTCPSCNKIFHSDDMLGHEDDFLCESCFDDKYTTCYQCGVYIRQSGAIIVAGNNSICQNCLYEHYAPCANCGEIHLLENLRYNDRDDEYYCESCYEDAYNSDLSELDPYEIYDYTLKPDITFKRHNEKTNLYMGFELEFNYPDNDHDDDEINKDDIAKLLLKYLPHNAYRKHDRSITDGEEIVTNPLSKNYQHKHINWHGFLKGLSSLGCTGFEKGEAGIHVHINRDYVSNSDNDKIWLFLISNRTWITKYSKRTGDQLRQWATIPDEIPITQSSRYYAINKTSKTYEFRLFRGTLNYGRFITIPQFIESIVLFAKQYSYSVFKGSNSLKHYIEFLNNNGRFTKLYTYLKKRGLLCA